MDKQAAIAQIEAAIKDCDVVDTMPLQWDSRHGVTNTKARELLARRSSLLLALESVKAS